MSEFLAISYPWIKALHVMAVIAWMAGLFYLPRLFVYHVEQAKRGGELYGVFQVMEQKLLRLIMTPSLVVTWAAGLALVLTPGIVDWSSLWPWAKLAGVVAMTWFHFWLAGRQKGFVEGMNRLSGRQYRMMNEVPTILMVVIVLAVIVKF